MSKFSFSVSQGFATLSNIATLSSSVSLNIPVQLQTINPYGDAIEIIFIDALTEEQKVQLNNLVTQWDSHTQITYTHIVPIYLRAKGINNTTYQRCGIYGYLGAKTVGEIKKICIVAAADNAVTNYSVKIYDSINLNVIAQAVFTNKTEMLLDLGQISNVPETPSIIEIHLKKIGGTDDDKIYSENIVFYS